MTTHKCKRIFEHPIIDELELCIHAGIHYEEVYDVVDYEREITDRELQKIEAYLTKWGIEWRDLIKEEL